MTPRAASWAAAALAALVPVAAAAQEGTEPGPGHPGEALTVYLVTMGPGDRIWEKFGHNALWISDRSAGTDVAWNWGLFDFDQSGFVARLARGTMLYAMGPESMERTLQVYRYFGRSVRAQELDLTPEQRWRIRTAVHEQYPDDRFYRYDYYRDNCSTRVRDLLDRVLGGALRARFDAEPTGTTYRWHTRRLLRDSPAGYAGIQFVLGHPGDRALTRWDEMFLPLRLAAAVDELTVPGPDGAPVPLVRRRLELLEARGRDPVPEAPRSRLGAAALIGLTWAVLTAALAALGGRTGAVGTAGRVGTALAAGGWLVVAGVAGTVLVLAWLFTDHVFWTWNENLFQASPVTLAGAAFLAPLLRGGRVAPGGVVVLTAAAALAALGAVLQVLPPFDQVNGEVVALALPPNLAAAWAAWRLRRPAAETGGGRPGHG